MSAFILPLLICALLIYARFKRVECYDGFVAGAKKGLALGFEIFPFICAIMLAVAVLRASGITVFLTNILAPVFNFFGMPVEICELLILRPFTGSGSLALLNDLYSSYGADSYVSRCASVIVGSSETIFYVAAVYFSKTKIKKLGYAIPVSLLCTFVGAIMACLICKVI